MISDYFNKIIHSSMALTTWEMSLFITKNGGEGVQEASFSKNGMVYSNSAWELPAKVY